MLIAQLRTFGVPWRIKVKAPSMWCASLRPQLLASTALYAASACSKLPSRCINFAYKHGKDISPQQEPIGHIVIDVELATCSRDCAKNNCYFTLAKENEYANSLLNKVITAQKPEEAVRFVPCSSRQTSALLMPCRNSHPAEQTAQNSSTGGPRRRRLI
jgi:hypothetical protein